MKKLSIIIPTLNSHGVVKSQIIRLQNILFSYQNDVDVIIVDDGSNPSLVESLIETNFPFVQNQEKPKKIWMFGN
jgi:glycosyltransferase involved in cell wall biosynthesis